MFEPTLFTCIIIIFGASTIIPLLVAKLFMLINPSSQKTRDLIIGKNEDWRDNSHFKYSLAFAWANWLIIFPLFLIGNIGVLTGHLWGYLSWMAPGVVSAFYYFKFCETRNVGSYSK